MALSGGGRWRTWAVVTAIAALSAAGSVLPPVAGRAPSALLLAITAAVVFVAVRGLRPVCARETPDTPVHFEIWIMAAAAMVAVLLRFPKLASVPPGITADDAYHVLQAIALWSGEAIPELPEYPYPTYPVWWLITGTATRILGPTVEGARVVSAFVGTLTILLAWKCARDLLGRPAGIAAALFVCGSFWHVNYSRQGLPWTLLVAETLAVAWLLLARRISTRWWACALAGVIAGGACYGYTAAFYLPAWGLLTLGIRTLDPETTRRHALVSATLFAAGACVVLLPGLSHIQLRVERARAVAAQTVNELAAPANLLAGTPTSRGHWNNYPPGTPRLSPVERGACLLGLCALLAIPGLRACPRLPLILMVPLALAPEMGGGSVHLSRGLGTIAPLALLAGCAGNLMVRLGGRGVIAAALAAAALNAVWTGKVLYLDFPKDKTTRDSYDATSVLVAERLREICEKAPIELSPYPAYEGNPALRLLLWRELRDGKILPVKTVPPGSGVVILEKFRHPIEDDPFLFIATAPRFPVDRRVFLMSIIGMAGPGRNLEERGDLMGAEFLYRELLRQFPDSRYTRVRLGHLLLKMGRREEARKHLEAARLPSR